MTFVADENLDSAVVNRLRDEGHEVLFVAEMSPSVSDNEVLGQANEAQALLLTADKDFGELVFRLRRVQQGVIPLRLHGLSAASKADIVAETVRVHGAEMMDAFTVIARHSVRIRPASPS